MTASISRHSPVDHVTNQWSHLERGSRTSASVARALDGRSASRRSPFKENTMRRFLFALLLAPINVVTSHAPSDALSHPATSTLATLATHTTTPRSITVPTRHANIQSVLTQRELRASALRLRVGVSQLRQMWQRVAVCEVGGNWSMTGPMYSGIGFLNSTWSHYGGTRYAPLAGLATRDEQILIGMRVTGGYVPDQYGCSPVGW